MLKAPESNQKPTIADLGSDLLTLSRFNLVLTLVVPFSFFILYFVFAFNGFWIPAVGCAVALSFASYGSTSHDLVHENLGIGTKVNSLLLSMLELLCFRSGHAYQLSHLYHHRRFPHEDDIEGAASRMTFVRSLAEGIIFQFKLYRWAISYSKTRKYFLFILTEGLCIIALIIFCIISIVKTPAFITYMGLMIAGSWIIPLVTSYAVHTPEKTGELNQTRLFRGRFFTVIAFNHLFHLEHHLYPMVPHKNWPELARRLDQYFEREGIKAISIPTIKIT